MVPYTKSPGCLKQIVTPEMVQNSHEMEVCYRSVELCEVTEAVIPWNLSKVAERGNISQPSSVLMCFWILRRFLVRLVVLTIPCTMETYENFTKALKVARNFLIP